MNTYQFRYGGYSRHGIPPLDFYAEQRDERLIWLYGHERFKDIRLGRDEKTNADIAAWRALGR